MYELLDVNTGDEVGLREDGRWAGLGEYGSRQLDTGMVGVVGRVTAYKAVVRFPVSETTDVSFWIPKEELVFADPDRPKPRKIGEVPEGGIAADDPRLNWLWEDAATLAKQQGYCGHYDRLTNELGIPGRPRSFKVTGKVGSLSVSGNYTARSRDEAEAMLRAEMTGLTGINVTED